MALVAMKRLRVIAPQEARRALLRSITKLGCAEIEAAANSTDFGADARLMQTEESTGAAEYFVAVTQAYATLERLSPPKKRPMFARKPQLSYAQLHDEKTLEMALVAAAEINAASLRIEHIAQETAKRQNSILALKPWNSLDVPLDYKCGGDVAFLRGTMPIAAKTEQVRAQLEQSAPASILEHVSSDSEQHYLAVIVHKSELEAAMQALKQLGFSGASLKAQSMTALEAIAQENTAIAELEREKQEQIAKIAGFADSRQILEVAIDAYAQESEQDAVLSGLVHTSQTIVITGWVPAKAESAVAEILEKHGCAYSMDAPKEGENPPTAMDNGRIAAPFGAVTEMYGMPAYGSIIDPNPLMVIFYVTFFGFIMGDAVYGLIIALGCFLGLKLMRPTGTMKQMLTLFMYCGFSTIIAGILVGGYLGDALPQFTQAVFGRAITIPPIWFNPIEEPMTMLIFSIVLGAIQILVGMAIGAYRQIKQRDIRGAICGTLSWYLVFAGTALAVLKFSFGLYIALAGIALMFIFSSAKGLGKLTSGLGQLYNVTGFVSDLLSYSRIMALGLSGAVVGSVINKMGAMGGGGIGGILLFIVVGIIGHTFNIAISVLGAYVHTSRLQYIEFFGRFYEGGGRSMRPLTNKTKYVEMIREE